jgi:hypothetical protein
MTWRLTQSRFVDPGVWVIDGGLKIQPRPGGTARVRTITDGFPAVEMYYDSGAGTKKVFRRSPGWGDAFVNLLPVFGDGEN